MTRGKYIRTEKHKKKLSLIHKKLNSTGINLPPSQKGKLCDENNPAWKGDKVGYGNLHVWIRKNKIKPNVCEICKIKEPKEVSNISGEYKRDINDFQWLCINCHRKKDYWKNKGVSNV